MGLKKSVVNEEVNILWKRVMGHGGSVISGYLILTCRHILH